DEVREATRLSGILDIPIAEISVKYLEIPLTTKQIKAADCKILLEKIKGKINSWGSKFLSFARRLVLIQAVMFYIYNYWCQVVFLPKQLFEEMSTLEDLGEDEDNLIWFGSDHHKSAQVWDGLRVKPRNVRWWKLTGSRVESQIWLDMGKSPGNIYFLSVGSQPLFGENCSMPK
ncbi:hypothetical protein Leryth_026234, partial [Lithospermum erythrorhizon]